MCRSIKTLRPPYVDEVTQADVEAAALQYVRKIAGMRKPSQVNEAAFSAAVVEVAAATSALLADLTVRPAPPHLDSDRTNHVMPPVHSRPSSTGRPYP